MRTPLNHILASAAIFALSLQLAVPAGFMPTSVDDGWYLKWCPDGMSEQVMMALFGHDHHHHTHEQGSRDNAEVQNCELAAFSADLLQASAPSISFSSQPDLEPIAPNPAFTPIKAARAFLARAPPISKPI